jgi:hypothetical protein
LAESLGASDILGQNGAVRPLDPDDTEVRCSACKFLSNEALVRSYR